MKVQLKYDYDKICKNFLKQKLAFLDIKYKVNSAGEIEILQPLNAEEKEQLFLILNSDGISIINNHNKIIVQKIKELIVQMIHLDNDSRKMNLSQYLEDKLPYSYIHLSKVFSEDTYMTIEKFTILKKIEYVKELLSENRLSLSEIAYRLNYSSVSHLSNQFKKTTGLTPSYFLNLKKQLETVS